MKAIFKILGIVFGIIIVLVFAAIIILPQVFDPNDHKGRIEALVLEKTGRVLTIDGDLSLSVFPKIAIKTGPLTFSNPDGGQFGDNKMVEIESASMDVQLMPLLSKSVEAGEVVLVNPVVRLITLPDGMTNWADLTGAGEAPRDTINESSSLDQSPIRDFEIQGVRVERGTVVLDDQAAQKRYELSELSVTTGPIAAERDVSLQAQAQVNGSDLPEAFALDINTIANVTLDGPVVTLSDLGIGAVGETMAAKIRSDSFVFDAEKFSLASPVVELEAKVDGNAVLATTQNLAMDLGANQLRVAKLNAEVTSGEADATLSTDELSFDIGTGGLSLGETNGQVAVGSSSARVSLAPWVTRLDQREFVFENVSIDADVDGLAAQVVLPSIAIDTETMSVAATGASVTAEGVRASLDLTARDLANNLNYEGRLRLPASDLRALSAKFGAYVPSDDTALTSVALDADFSGSATAIDVPLVTATLDQTAIEGSAAIDLAESRYQLRLSADAINVDRYLPGDATGVAESQDPSSDGADAKSTPLVIGDINLDAELEIGQLAIPSADLVVDALTLTAVADASNRLPLTVSGTVGGGAVPESLRLSAEAGLESAGEDIRLSDASVNATSDTLTATLSTPAIVVAQDGPIALNDVKGAIRQAEVEATLAVSKLDFDAQASLLKLQGVSLDSGVAGIDASLEAVDLSGDLGTQVFELSEVVVDATGTGPVGKLSAPLVRVDLAQEIVDANSMTFASDAGEASIALRVNDFTTKPRFDGSVNSEGLNVRTLLEALDVAPNFADPDALTSVSVATTIQGNLDAISLEPLEVTIDGTPITGFVQIQQLPQASYYYEIDAGRIDLDRYMPVADTDPSSDSGADAAGGDAGDPAALKNLSINGTINLESLRSGGIELTSVSVTTETADGVITVAPISANLYEGTASGSVVIDTNGDVPVISAEQSLSELDVGAALAASGVSEKLIGTGTLVAKIDARGLDATAISESMAGTIDFNLRDGAIKGFDLQSILVKARRAYEQYKDRDTMFEGELEEQTKFSAMTGSLVLDNGIARNSDLSVAAPLFRVNGAGEASLIEQTIDYDLTVNLVKSAEGQGGAQLADLDNIPIPLKIGGSFAQPTFRVDLAGLLKEKAKEEAKDRLKEKLSEELGLPQTTDSEGGKQSTRDTVTGLLKKKLEQEAGGGEESSAGASDAAGVDTPPARKRSKDILLDVLNKSIEGTPPPTTDQEGDSPGGDTSTTEQPPTRLDDLIQSDAETDANEPETRRTTLDGLLGSDDESVEQNTQPKPEQDAGREDANERDQLEEQLKKKLLDKLFN